MPPPRCRYCGHLITPTEHDQTCDPCWAAISQAGGPRHALTTRAVAERIGVPHPTLARWVQKYGLLTPTGGGVSGRPYFWAADDVMRARRIADLRREGLNVRALRTLQQTDRLEDMLAL